MLRRMTTQANVPVRRKLNNGVITTVQMEPAQREHLERVSKELNCSISEAIRVMVEEHRIRYERAQKRGSPPLSGK